MPKRNPNQLTCDPSRPTERSTVGETMRTLTAWYETDVDGWEYDMVIVNEEIESDNKATPFNSVGWRKSNKVTRLRIDKFKIYKNNNSKALTRFRRLLDLVVDDPEQLIRIQRLSTRKQMSKFDPNPLTCDPSRPTERSTVEGTMRTLTAWYETDVDGWEYDDMVIVNEEMESDNKATPFNRTFTSNHNCVICHHEPGGTRYKTCDYCPAVLCLHCARNLQRSPPALALMLHDGCQLPSHIGRQFESLPNCRECGGQVYRGESHETCVRCTSCVHFDCDDPNHPHTH